MLSAATVWVESRRFLQEHAGRIVDEKLSLTTVAREHRVAGVSGLLADAPGPRYRFFQDAPYWRHLEPLIDAPRWAAMRPDILFAACFVAGFTTVMLHFV
jgi:hypothetical protein